MRIKISLNILLKKEMPSSAARTVVVAILFVHSRFIIRKGDENDCIYVCRLFGTNNNVKGEKHEIVILARNKSKNHFKCTPSHIVPLTISQLLFFFTIKLSYQCEEE